VERRELTHAPQYFKSYERKEPGGAGAALEEIFLSRSRGPIGLRRCSAKGRVLDGA